MTRSPYDEASRDPVFSCRNLGITFGAPPNELSVLAGVDFDVYAGEFLALLGTSGVGKTTLLRILGGLQSPAPRSDVRCHGKAVEGPPERVVMVFQDYASSLLPWRSVSKNVALGLENSLGKEERRQRVADTLELVGLGDRGDAYPWQLSGGMQQRVQLARAFALQADVLLMDEPFGALDAMTKAGLQDELQELQLKTGTTIVFITHDIDEAVYLSDRIIVLGGAPGRIVLERDVSLARPRDQISTKEDPLYLQLRHDVYDAVRRHSQVAS